MKSYWQQLNERERLMVGIGIGCVIPYLLYILLYAPITKAVENKTRQMVEKKETLSWMLAVRNQNIREKSPKNLNQAELLTLLANQLNAEVFQSFKYQLQQSGTGDIQLSFEEVPYSLFLKWLQNLTDRYAISIKKLMVERTDLPGIVKLYVTLVAEKNRA